MQKYLIQFILATTLSQSLCASLLQDLLIGSTVVIAAYAVSSNKDPCHGLPTLRGQREFTKLGGDSRAVLGVFPDHIKCLFAGKEQFKIVYENRHMEMIYFSKTSLGEPNGFIEDSYDVLELYQDLRDPEWYYFKYVLDSQTIIHRVEIGGVYQEYDALRLRAVEVEMGLVS